MANTKISALPDKLTPSPLDLVPIVDTANPQNLITKKTRLGDIFAAFVGLPGGAASLDSSGKVPIEQLPALAITDTFVVESAAELTALDAQVGDVAVRLDLNKTFILAEAPSNDIQNWIELLAAGISATNQLDGGSF